MKPAPFRYRRASTLDEAVALLAEAGEDARILAGGQSLVPMMNFRIARPSALIDINRCADLAAIRREGEHLLIGATVRQRQAERDPLVAAHAPVIAQALAAAGPATVRHRGTVGGSLANAYPLAHLPNVMLSLGATVHALGPNGPRAIGIDTFLIGAMETGLDQGDVLAAIAVPVLAADERAAFAEARNHAGGAATALVSLRLTLDGLRVSAARIAASGLDDHAIRLPAVEAALIAGEDLAPAYRADLATREFALDDEATRHAEQVVPHLLTRALADARTTEETR